MNNNEKHKFNENTLLYILPGVIINMGVLYLPSSVGKHAKQDGWISLIIASIYPLYVTFCAIYLKHKHNNKNILTLSNEYFGNFLGGLLNLLFICEFAIILSSSASATFNFIKNYTSIPINNKTFILMFLIIGVFAANLGLNTLIKISALIFYLIIPIFITGLNVLKYGSILNILPIGSSGLPNILLGILDTVYAYSGIEVLLILYSDYDDKKRIAKYSLLSTLFVILIYTGITFLIGVYWENSLVQRTLWPSIYIVESIRNPILNNLRFLLLYFWTIVTLKSISLYFYFINEGLLHIFKRFKLKDFYLAIYVLILPLALRFKNEIMRREFSSKLISYSVLFNLIFITVIVIFTFIKKDDNS